MANNSARFRDHMAGELKRITGSHHIYARSGDMARITVPVHANSRLKIGLQKHLMKIAGLDESDLHV